MSNHIPTSLIPSSANKNIVNWCATTLRDLHVAIPNQHFKNGEQITITMHPDGCLLLYPIARWAPMAEKMKSLPTSELLVFKLQD
jgi:hypothetical protein